jgi:gliding motility-associated-like protein
MRFIVFFLLFMGKAYGQGDDCLSATYLPNVSTFCSTNLNYTNVGATTGLTSLPTCWPSSATQDVWFQFIATGTDVLISVNGSGSGGSMIAPNIALYTGNCTLLFELGCSAGAIGAGSTQLYEGALSPGTTYFIRVSSLPSYQGSFILCANCYTPNINPGADCGGAAYLCNQNSVSVASLSGGGLDNDEPEPGTCLDVWGPDEGNSSWFKWTCQTSGTLTFDITPINANDDIDFILYQLSGTNACGPRTPIRCNSSSCLNTTGSTGLNLVDLDIDEWPNCDPGENAYCQYITMTAGVSYAILINNFSASTGFTLSFNTGNTNNPGTFLGPHPILNHTSTTICQGSSVTFNATGSTNVSGGLNWIFSNGVNSSTASGNGPFTITYANPGYFLGILNGLDQFGCQATEFVNIEVTAPPVLTNPATQTICSNNSTNISLMNAIPAGTTVQWTVSSNAFVSGASNGSGASINQILTNNSNQVRSITYTITATKGPCTVVSTTVVYINPLILPTFNSVAPICQGGNLAALPTSSLNGITGTWSPALNNQTTTTYTFTPTVGQCAATTTLSITVNAQVTPTFAAVNAICQGGNLAALPTSSLNGITGTWSPALNNQATTTYSFTPTAGQCATTTTLTITVNAQITPTFAAVSPICQGGNLAALPTSSLNGISGTWSPALNNQTTTTYTFTPSAGQCATTTTLTITVNPQVTPTFASVSPICQGGNLAALPTSSLNGITGTWSPALNNQTTTTYTFTPTAGQCASTTTLAITVNPQVTPTFAAVSPICQGGNLAALPTSSLNGITGTWSPALNNQATTTYTFTPAAGQCAIITTLAISVNAQVTPTFASVSPICQGGNLAALPTSSLNGITGTWSPALNNQTTTTYTFTPTAGQCATTTTLTITINPQVAQTFAAVNAICQGGNLAALPTSSLNGITGTWSPALNNQTTTTYTFTPTAGQCATTAPLTITVNAQVTPTFAVVSPICQGGNLAALPTSSLNGITGTWSPALNNQATTTYSFTPTAGQCATTTTLTISVNVQVTPTFSAVSSICQGGNLAALPTSSLNGITGTWSPALNNQATTTYTFTPTAGQCATTTTLPITVNPQVTPTFAAVNAICQGGNLAALPTSSLNGITGTWSPALNNQTTTTYTFTPFAGQCATTTTLTITVNPQVTPTFAAVNAICQGGNLAALPTSSLNGITGTWSPALNNQTTTIYTFTPSAGQCATTTTLTITVNPQVTPTFASVSPICQSGNLAALPTSSLNGITGTWLPALNNQTTTTYTFTPSAGQCATTTTLTITVNPQVTPTFASVSPICQGGNLAALPTSSLNGITGTWSPALNNQATTTYTFTPSAGQCATTTTLTITVNPQVTPTFASVSPICQGGNLAALPTSSLNGITGTWSPALNNQTTTTYTFTPSAGQCATTTTLTITVNPQVTPTFAAVSPICQSGNLAALPTSSLNGITGTWSPALNNQTTTTYTFTPTSGQCATTTTLTITVNPQVTPTFASVSPICQGGNLAALPTSSLNGITGTWSPALNNQTTTTTYTFTPSAGQCATTTTLTITVNPQVTPTFASVSPICQGGNLAALPTSSLNGITGTWSPAVNNQSTTTYTFTPTAGQCASTTTLAITVNPQVTPTFAAVNPICQGGNVAALPTSSLNGITGTWSPALNNQTTTTYTFTPTSGQCATTTTLTITVNAQVTPTFATVSPICQGGNLAALPTSSLNGITGTWSPALNNQTTTTYTFTPSAGQCATTTTLTITVNPQVTPTFASVNAICQGGNLAALPTSSLNGITGTWSPALNNQATTTYTFTPSAGQCATTTTLAITVNAQVTPTFASVSPICQSGNLAALPTSSLNGITGTWSPALNNQVTTTYTFTPSIGMCTSSASVTISIIEQPIAQFSITPNDSILIGSTLYFQNTSLNANSFIWQVNNQEFSTEVHPSFLTSEEEFLVFTLIALNQTCTDTFEIQVPLIENSFVYAANCFTPDADEFNPTWKPYISDNFDLSNYQLTIYNRWGEVIWESFDYHEAWDGTYGSDGQDVQDGVYTWVLQLKKKKNDEVSSYSGTLIRIR